MKAGCYQFNPAFGKKEENLNRVASALKNAGLQLLVLPVRQAGIEECVSLLAFSILA